MANARFTSLSAVATGTGTAFPVSEYNCLTMVAESSAGVSAGVITFEAAATDNFAGTWISLGTVTTNAASSAFAVSATLVCYGAVRARITTNITGGTVTVYILGNS